MKSLDRTKQIVAVALEIAHAGGLHKVTSVAVAKKLGLTHGNILHHVGTAELLRTMTARQAIIEGDRNVMANMITTAHPVAKEIPDELRREILGGL